MRPCVLTEAEPWVRCQPVCILQSHGRCGMHLFKDQPRVVPLHASRKLAFTPSFGAQWGSCFGSDDSDRHVLETASHPDIRSAVAIGEADLVGAGGALGLAAKVDVEPLVER